MFILWGSRQCDPLGKSNYSLVLLNKFFDIGRFHELKDAIGVGVGGRANMTKILIEKKNF